MTINKVYDNNFSDLVFNSNLPIYNKDCGAIFDVKTKTNCNKLIKDKSNHLENSQQNFLSSIIHELKNPLNAISGLSKILQDEKGFKVSPKERIEYLHNIDESINDLNELVHDLLDISVAGNEQANFSIDLSKKIDIKEIVRRAIKLNKDYALQCHISIKSEISENVDFINLDPKRTKQILNNLITNAVKYSPQRTEITISVRNVSKNNDQYLEIIISDEGFGMTKEQVETAFKKYQTIKNPNSDKVDSFGLGLPIVQELVELQNGTIEVQSEPNKGTKFIINFPYQQKM